MNSTHYRNLTTLASVLGVIALGLAFPGLAAFFQLTLRKLMQIGVVGFVVIFGLYFVLGWGRPKK